MKIMLSSFMFLVICLSSAAYPQDDAGNDWIIVIGKRVGPITITTNEAELVRYFGKESVMPSNIEIGEGETMPGTIIYPNDPERKIEIIWRNANDRGVPATIIVRGQRSKWRTSQGISLGTSLKQLEVLNGKVFTLAGFGWDYGGTVLDFNEGALCKSGFCNAVEKGIIKPRKILLRLDAAVNRSDEAVFKDYRSVSGDRSFSSGNPAMIRLNPTVYEMNVDISQ